MANTTPGVVGKGRTESTPGQDVAPNPPLVLVPESASPLADVNGPGDFRNHTGGPKIASLVEPAGAVESTSNPGPTTDHATRTGGRTHSKQSFLEQLRPLTDLFHLANDLRAFRAKNNQDHHQDRANDSKLAGKVANVLGDSWSIISGAGGAAALGYVGHSLLLAAAPSLGPGVAIVAAVAAGYLGYSMVSETIGRIGHMYISKLCDPANYGDIAGVGVGAVAAAGVLGITVAASAPIWGSALACSAAFAVGVIATSKLVDHFFGDLLEKHSDDGFEKSSFKKAGREKKQRAKPQTANNDLNQQDSPEDRTPSGPPPAAEPLPRIKTGVGQEMGGFGAIGQDSIGQGRANFGLPTQDI